MTDTDYDGTLQAENLIAQGPEAVRAELYRLTEQVRLLTERVRAFGEACERARAVAAHLLESEEVWR